MGYSGSCHLRCSGGGCWRSIGCSRRSHVYCLVHAHGYRSNRPGELNKPCNLVNVFAQDQAELENNGDNGVTVKAEVDSSTQSIKFEVAAPSEQESMDIANRLAERTADAVQSALVEQGAAYMEAVDEMGNQPLAEEGTYINAGATADERLPPCVHVSSQCLRRQKLKQTV